MLLQFAVENYKSIASREVLSFLAVPGEPHPRGQVVDVPGIGPVLRSLVLYGANASGKSSVVSAFEAARSIILDGAPPGGSLPVSSHKLSGGGGRPSSFEFEVALEGVHYAYGIRTTSTRVVAEWLVRVEAGGDKVVFERDDVGEDRPRVVFGPGLASEGDRRLFYSFVAEGTRHEQPLVAELRARNATELSPLFDFFNRVVFALPDEEWREAHFISFALRFPDIRTSFSRLLLEAGTGVASIQLVSTSPEVQSRIDADEDFSWEEADLLSKTDDSRVRLVFRHRGASGTIVPLELHELSDGTRRLLRLAALVDIGGYCSVGLIDELDRSLHTQLTRFLMERLNASGGTTQFVFTTHDTNLLDAGVFGRDAIWFVEKDAEGASHLSSLASFDKAQLDALTGHVEEGYLQGRFGAIPFISEPGRLSWPRP